MRQLLRKGILISGFYDILVKKCGCFLPCSKTNLLKAKLKHFFFRLMALVEEIFIQLSADHVLWLWVASLIQLYNKIEQAEQEEYKIHSLKRIGAWGKVMELSPVIKEINRLKKSLWQGYSTAVTASSSCPPHLSTPSFFISEIPSLFSSLSPFSPFSFLFSLL